MILLRPADMLVASVVLLSLTSLTHASVPCNDGFVEYECADQYPVCCTWKVNDVIAACCPPSATCDLSEGFCIVHHVVNNRSTTPPPQTPSQGGITVAVSEAAAFITFGAIGFIIAVVGCAFLAFKVFIMAQAYRQRRQQEEYERVLQASGSEEDDDAADGKEEDGGDDEEGQCTLCFSHRMNCVLLPCAHVCTCRACASKLSQCPLCRSEIKSFRPFKNRIYIRSAKPIADVPAPAVESRRNDDAPVVVTVPTSARRAAAAAPAAVDSARCASEELTPTPRVALDATPRMPISARARPVTLVTDDDDEASGRLRIAAYPPSAVAQIAEHGAADQTDDDPSTCADFDAEGHHLQDASVAAEAAQREGAPSPAVEDI